jgi:transcriptional/translational regulatory protein YebC/TACO1
VANGTSVSRDRLVAYLSDLLDAEQTLSVIKLLDALEDLDDVQQVHSNAEFSDEALATLT